MSAQLLPPPISWALAVTLLLPFADPTPKDGDLWRPKAIEMGGKKQFPYMVDPNTGEWQVCLHLPLCQCEL